MVLFVAVHFVQQILRHYSFYNNLHNFEKPRIKFHSQNQWATRLQKFLYLDGTSFDELLEIVAATVTKRNTCEKQSLSVSVNPLHQSIWPLEMLLKTLNSKMLYLLNPLALLHWRCLLPGRQMIIIWILHNTNNRISIIFL